MKTPRAALLLLPIATMAVIALGVTVEANGWPVSQPGGEIGEASPPLRSSHNASTTPVDRPRPGGVADPSARPPEPVPVGTSASSSTTTTGDSPSPVEPTLSSTTAATTPPTSSTSSSMPQITPSTAEQSPPDQDPETAAQTHHRLLGDFVAGASYSVAQNGWDAPQLTITTPVNRLDQAIELQLIGSAGGANQWGISRLIGPGRSRTTSMALPEAVREIELVIGALSDRAGVRRTETLLIDQSRTWRMQSIELARSAIGPVAEVWSFVGTCWFSIGPGDTGVRTVVNPKIADVGPGGDSELCLPPAELRAPVHGPATWYLSGEFVDAYGRYPVTTAVTVDPYNQVTTAPLVGDFSVTITQGAQ